MEEREGDEVPRRHKLEKRFLENSEFILHNPLRRSGGVPRRNGLGKIVLKDRHDATWASLPKTVPQCRVRRTDGCLVHPTNFE